MSVVSSLEVVLGADVAGLTSGLQTADNKVKNFASKAGTSLQNLGGQFTGLGVKVTAMSLPIAAFGIAGIQAAADFESSMAEISARTGLVGEDLEMISDFALQMGADTSFSAQQAADAFLQLTSSGQSAEQAIATLPAVLDLAAASGADLGATADTVTDIMAQFGLEVTEANTVTNALAQAAGASSATITDLSEAFGNVGGIASSFGLDVGTTAAILAIFAENGIKGAEAGTQLKSMLLNFNSDTAQSAFEELGVSLYDTQGNIRPLTEVITDLDTALDLLPVEEQNRLMQDLAGSYGITGLNALRGATSIEEMMASMDKAADASEIAAGKTNTFAGRADALAGSIETLQINALTPFMENVLKPMVEELTKIVNSISDWAAENPALASTIVAVGAGIVILGPALIGLGIGISAVGTAISGLSVAFTLLSGPLLPIIIGLAGVAAGVVAIKALVDSGALAAGIAGWTSGLNDAAIVMEVVFDRIKTGMYRFSLDTQLQLQTWIGTIRKIALDASGGAIDIAPNFVADTDALRTKIAETEIGDMVYEQLKAQIDSGEPLDLGQMQNFTVTVGDAPVTIQGSLADALLDPQILADMGVQGRMLVESALTTAFTISDQQTIDLLSPVAVQMGIDLVTLEADAKAQIQSGNYDTTVTANISVNSVISFLQNVPSLISDTIAGAGAAVQDFVYGVESQTPQVPGFAEGTDYVDKTGLAIIHEGERILTKEQNKAISGMMAGGSTGGSGIGAGGGSRAAGNTYYISSYGQSPRELIELMKRELAADSL